MKKNYISLLVYLVILALLIGLPFTFVGWNKALVNENYTFIFYLVTKIVFGLLFVGFVIYGFTKEMARGMYLYTFIATLALQFIPLLVRLGMYTGGFKYAYSPILVGVSLIAYLAFIAGTTKTNKLQLEADKKYEGNTIPVKEER